MCNFRRPCCGFEGMADYQYVLAVHVDTAKRGQKRRNAEEHFG